MKKKKFDSHHKYLQSWRMSRLTRGFFTIILFLGTAMWFMGVAHLFSTKTSETDSTLHNGQVLSAMESKNKQLLQSNLGSKYFDCISNNPVKGVINLNSKKVYFEPKNPSYLYTKPDSCFPNIEAAQSEGYESDSRNNLQETRPDSINESNPENIKSENTVELPESNIVYESVTQDIQSPEVLKSVNDKNKSASDLPKNLTFEQMLERSKQTKIIVVSIDNQNLKTLESGEVKSESAITSGKKTFETPKDSFLILNKARNIRLKSPGPRFGDYDLPVKYWLGIGNGYGFHDASWRSNFGVEGFEVNGSHGCINMPLESVKSLYSWADVGTEVYIV